MQEAWAGGDIAAEHASGSPGSRGASAALLPAAHSLRIVGVMPDRACRSASPFVVPLLAAAALVACGREPATDPANRKIPWSYAPTTGGAAPEHRRATGAEGGKAVAEGWRCRLQDGRTLTVQPYKPAASHPLFGKVALTIGLFDQQGRDLATFVSPVLTATPETWTFELAETVARDLCDVVIWIRSV
jgi:hypothetical protein